MTAFLKIDGPEYANWTLVRKPQECLTLVAAVHQAIGGYGMAKHLAEMPAGYHYIMIVNTDGKNMGMAPTVAVVKAGKVEDVVMGTCAVVKMDLRGNHFEITEADLPGIKTRVYPLKRF